MIITVEQIEFQKWQVSVDFSDESVNQITQNIIIGTEQQAHAYGATLGRDYKNNHPDLFPEPEPIINDEEMML